MRACKSSDELIALAKDEGIELTDDELKAVSGGVDWYGCLVYDGEGCCDCPMLNCTTHFG